jgi:hypothetical protein
MATQNKPVDERALKKELKRLEKETKNRKKQMKRERKMKKLELKKRKKEALLSAKLGAKGDRVPAKVKGKPGEVAVKIPEGDGEKLPEAEIVADADVWTPKSAKKLDEIQKLIDRMDHDGVKSLKDRYKEKYGEDIEIPDAYEAKSSFEVETAEEAGELEKVPTESKLVAPAKKEKGKLSLLSKKKKEKKEKMKVDRPLRLLDIRTPFYLRDKFGADSGGGKRAILLIIDIILNILLIILVIKIITTIIYILKDRKQAKLQAAMDDQGATPQPTS